MGRAGRPTVAIELADEERETLVRWSRRHSSSQALALRSRIALACADGRAGSRGLPVCQLNSTNVTLPALSTWITPGTPAWRRRAISRIRFLATTLR